MNYFGVRKLLEKPKNALKHSGQQPHGLEVGQLNISPFQPSSEAERSLLSEYVNSSTLSCPYVMHSQSVDGRAEPAILAVFGEARWFEL